MKTRWGLWLAGLAVIVGLPFLGKWVRRGAAPRCDFDGIRIEPLYRVRVVGAGGDAHPFCCVRCARRWIARQLAPPAAVFVTDEASGAELPAGTAYFVESAVVTNRVTGNDVHVFRDRNDAETHAHEYGGTVLTGADRPFNLVGPAVPAED
jgi:hypothetical protein